jgi:hypothetical protein
VVDQYAKHGWQLRRALLSNEIANSFLAQPAFAEVKIVAVNSGNEALWFSRRSLPDREAWELRRLSGSPFALVAILEDSFDNDERETVLAAPGPPLFDGSHPEPTSH